MEELRQQLEKQTLINKELQNHNKDLGTNRNMSTTRATMTLTTFMKP